VDTLQPLRFRVIEPRNTFAWIDEEIRDADDIRLWAVREIMVGPDPDAIGCAEATLVSRHDAGSHALFACFTTRDKCEIPPGRAEEVKHAKKCRSRNLWHCEYCDI
jgi:hypothetical protein